MLTSSFKYSYSFLNETIDNCKKNLTNLRIISDIKQDMSVLGIINSKLIDKLKCPLTSTRIYSKLIDKFKRPLIGPWINSKLIDKLKDPSTSTWIYSTLVIN